MASTTSSKAPETIRTSIQFVPFVELDGNDAPPSSAGCRPREGCLSSPVPFLRRHDQELLVGEFPKRPGNWITLAVFTPSFSDSKFDDRRGLELVRLLQRQIVDLFANCTRPPIGKEQQVGMR